MSIRNQKRNLYGKKGNAFLDTMIFVVLFFAIAMSWLIGNLLSENLTQDAREHPDLFSNTSMQIIEDNNTNYPILFDNLFVFAFALFWLLTLVASYNIEVYPIFFVVSVILLIFVFIFAAIMTNTWEEVVADPELNNLVDNFPKMNFIMTHWLETSIMVGASILFILYAKNR